MSRIVFHNNTCAINTVWYDSHAQLLRMACLELGKPDKCEELIEKFLGNKMKIKPQKNPNQPKRPKSAYFYFCDEKRPAIIKKARGKSGKDKVAVGEVAKELGEMWKKKKDKDKKKYETLAKEDKERYVKEMEEFQEKNQY